MKLLQDGGNIEKRKSSDSLWQQQPGKLARRSNFLYFFCLPVKVISLGLFHYLEGSDGTLSRLPPVLMLRANLSLLSKETGRPTQIFLPILLREKVETAFCLFTFISWFLLENDYAVFLTTFSL